MMIISNDTVTEKYHSSSIKHCGLLGHVKIYVLELVLENDNESLGKSAYYWLSTIVEKSITTSRSPFWFDVSSS